MSDRSPTQTTDPAGKWEREAEQARLHSGEMLTYLRGLLDSPMHLGIHRCARELITQIEKDAERAEQMTHGSPELDEDARKLEALGGDPGPIFADLETTEQLTRDFVRERWFGEIQTFLEQMIDAAPDETCRVFGRDLWQHTAEFTDGD